MKILFHRYGSICEPDILSVFRSMGIEVTEESAEITDKRIPSAERVRLLTDALFKDSCDFVFSLNYFPYISEVCMRFHIPYVCFSVDCPVLELFSGTLANEWNRIFLFDYAQYLRFKDRNPGHIYYLPLATNVNRWDQALSGLSAQDRARYSSDVSFVGSLYLEKSPLSGAGFLRLSEQLRGYVDGITEAQLKVYGYNFLEEVTTLELTAELKKAFPDFPSLPDAHGAETEADRYVAANHYLGYRVASLERVRTLRLLSEKVPVTLYTRSLPFPNVSESPGAESPDTLSAEIPTACPCTATAFGSRPVESSFDPTACAPLLSKVDLRAGVSTLTEMPKVFNLSKINLNITIKPIQSGLSLRVWDVLGCGGFLLTNYQPELFEYFEIGTDLDCYGSMKELEEKAAFYLSHEDLRKKIARNGYEKVKAQHTWTHRIAQMLKTVYADTNKSDGKGT